MKVIVKLIKIFKNLHCERLMGKGWEQSLLAKRTLTFLSRLHHRDVRRQFVKDKSLWLMEKRYLEQWKKEWSASGQGAKMILADIPYTIPFTERVDLVRNHYESQKKDYKKYSRPVLIQVTRANLVNDAFLQVNKLKKEFRRTIRVEFTNALGRKEEGQDLGGVFKEFLEETLKQVFSDHFGLFKRTESCQYFPNPDSIVIPEMRKLMEFVGRMVGKSVFEGILIDVPLARFFVAKLFSNNVFLEDLHSMDPEKYKSLMYIKTCEDVSMLCLTFSVTREILGVREETDLIPGGRNTDVTNKNRLVYVYK
eukprot:UN31714